MHADEKELLTKENLELQQILADLRKRMLEGDKLQAEAMKILIESKWYPFVLAISLFAAGGAFVKFFA
ncbi:MAG: hypothetical protein LBL72_00260 [Candidatus Accumulibacter sp.]|jgi:hypothetical protein|nr:hypothetical protein [Accumulibacter sp.]